MKIDVGQPSAFEDSRPGLFQVLPWCAVSNGM